MSTRRFGNARTLKTTWFYVVAAIALTGCSDCGKESGGDQQSSSTTSSETRGDNSTTPGDRPGTRVLDPAARVPMRVGIARADAGAH